MKGTTAVLTALFVTSVLNGCAPTKNIAIQSTDSNLIYVGEEAPAGYPKAYVAKNGPSCENVTESWVKDKEPVSGKTMWRKFTRRTTISCE